MCLGENSLHMGVSQERTLPSLIQFISVSPKSTFAKHLTGDDQQFTWTTACLLSRTERDFLLVDSWSSCLWAVSAFKGTSHKDYLWAPSSGLKPMSRAWARCKHGNIFLSCRWSRNLGIKSKEGSKEEAPFSFCCSTVHSLILPSKMILKSYQCPFVSLNKQYQLPHHFSSTEALRNKNTRHTRHTVNLLLLKFQKHPKQYCSYYQNSTQNTTHA